MPSRSRKPRRFSVSTEAIVDSINEAIIEQRLPLGAKLAEERLCGIFGVSLTKVRQALNRLSQDRLVTLLPRRGAFITQQSPLEAQQLFDARRVVEREVVVRFAQNATTDQFAELDAHLAAERRAIEAGNVLLRTVTRHVPRQDRGVCWKRSAGADVDRAHFALLARAPIVPVRSVLCSTDEHAAVLDALRRRNAKSAIRLMDEHRIHVERDLAPLPKGGAEIDLAEALGFPRARTKRQVAA